MDNTLVTFLSSQSHEAEPNWCFRKGKAPDGSFYKIRVSHPSVAKDYSKFMGGVDLQ